MPKSQNCQSLKKQDFILPKLSNINFLGLAATQQKMIMQSNTNQNRLILKPSDLQSRQITKLSILVEKSNTKKPMLYKISLNKQYKTKQNQF